MLYGKSESQENLKIPKKQAHRPAVDLTRCTRCGGCLEVAPDIFQFNEAAGYLEICELDYYDESLVDEAIKNCPEDCLYWEIDEGTNQKI
ncbi:MAG: ferredoxin [Desulfobulbaceae bacterium]|nr:MAG: ferredoxin [Desulfobulbaceae bacterium]